MDDRTPEWLALLDAAAWWQHAYETLATLEARAYSTRDARDVAEAEHIVQCALNDWHRCHAAWLRANNDART